MCHFGIKKSKAVQNLLVLKVTSKRTLWQLVTCLRPPQLLVFCLGEVKKFRRFGIGPEVSGHGVRGCFELETMLFLYGTLKR